MIQWLGMYSYQSLKALLWQTRRQLSVAVGPFLLCRVSSLSTIDKIKKYKK